MSYTASSQTLRPLVQVVKNDTLFCFTIPQSKIIAKHLVNSQYADSLIISYRAKIKGLVSIRDFHNDIIKRQETKIDNLNRVNDTYADQVGHLNAMITTRDQQIKRSRRRNKLLMVGSAVLGALAILK